MGADIHAYIERVEENHIIDVAKVILPRSYDMFGLLAGVRSPRQPVFTPRGLPARTGYLVHEDLNPVIVADDDRSPFYSTLTYRQSYADKIQGEGGELHYFHSFGWLTAVEYAEVYDTHLMEFGCHPPDVYGMLRTSLFSLTNSRLVFWFDS